ncbi:MAG TPA: hypothetical protein DEQ47_13705 [Solibacterales bacterium]|nr:hypothetical protein [Bryobacterales bacterium]
MRHLAIAGAGLRRFGDALDRQPAEAHAEGPSRRDWVEQASLGLLATYAMGSKGLAAAPDAPDWVHGLRILNAEAYNPPFYPLYRYDPERAVKIAVELNANAFRYPAASYYAYFPTKTRYPIHPDLAAADPMRATVDLCHKAGVKAIAYIPINHPFMQIESKNPDFPNWVKRDSSGVPMTTAHYGFGRFYEGCLNSPLRQQIFDLVREVLTKYDFDVLYFDGPYQGMDNARMFCHCRYCRAAYRSARGKEIPRQDNSSSFEQTLEYTLWMRDEVVIATLRDVREMIRRTRDVPVLYNDTGLVGKQQWRGRAFPVVDGFMFEAAETPQQKLFNLQLGKSTGKTIWTYLGHHTQYNREHMKDQSVRGWYSYPIDGDELLLDGAIAVAAGAGMVYWSLSRLWPVRDTPLHSSSGRYVRQIFDFAGQHETMYRAARSAPRAGVLVGTQSIDWYSGETFVPAAYSNCFHGAYGLLKDTGHEAEPFLDFTLTSQILSKYALVWVPNAPCLSDAQCEHLTRFVEAGGTLIATHLTSVADEFGRRREQLGLSRLLGVRFKTAEPIERPDLYLRIPGQPQLIPQDPQIMPFETMDGVTVLAETWDAARERNLGPAIVARSHGKGRVLYIGSSLEAVYLETRLTPLREYFAGLLEPILGQSRRYRILGDHPGLMAHFRAAPNALYLHLLADAGGRVHKAHARETFLPISDLKVGIRMPPGRRAAEIRLLRAGVAPGFKVRQDWVELTVPRVLIHEAIEVRLA